MLLTAARGMGCAMLWTPAQYFAPDRALPDSELYHVSQATRSTWPSLRRVPAADIGSL